MMKLGHVAGAGTLLTVLGVILTAAFWLTLVYGVLWILREFGVLQALGVG